MAEENNVASNDAQAMPDEAFWRAADAFINAANEQAASGDRTVVSAGLLYASARFCSFVIATQCGNKETLEAEKADAIEYFVNQYKIALTENVTDYTNHFDKYINSAYQ